MTEKKNIYLDYNATSELKPEVIAEMNSVVGRPINPSSVHSFGREAKRIVEQARGKVAAMANAGNADVIFTASGTEANNLALRGIKADNYIVSAIEHPSVLETAKQLGATLVPVTESGVVDLATLEKILQEAQGSKLVSVMLANNETGVIQPVKEISQMVYKHGGYFHCDAAQGLGKIAVDMPDLNVDMLTVSAHKFGGPHGAAALIVKKGIDLHPFMFGGGQEGSKRAGTENVAAIAGFGKAAELVKQNIEKMKEVRNIRNEIEQELLEFAPDASVFGAAEDRLPNTICIYMPGMKAETQVINFDLEGIAVSAGSACSSGKVEQSHVLKAMGIDGAIAQNTIRISLTPDTGRDEAQYFIENWKKLYERANAKIKKAA